MKKVISIIFAILTLALLIVPASASNIVIGSDYRIENAFSGLEGVYAIYDSDLNLIEYVATFDYFDCLSTIYPLYKDSDSYKNGSDFEGYIWENYKIDTSVTIVYSIAAYYQQSQLMAETKAEFENYKSTDSTITEEEFSTYLQSSNPYLSYFYNQNLSSLVSEMIASSSSSSSGGSSGGSTPGENQGEHYGNSHDNTNHTIGDSDCCYNPGYNDGLLDGADEYKESNEYEETINNSKSEAVEQYKQSNEYKETLESVAIEASEIAVDEYLKSDEYQSTKDSCYAAGSDAGYTNAYEDACSEVYSRGKTDGYAEFRGSMEYSKAVNSAYSSGWDDGADKARESAVNPGGVIASIFILAGLIILLFILSGKKRKKNK